MDDGSVRRDYISRCSFWETLITVSRAICVGAAGVHLSASEACPRYSATVKYTGGRTTLLIYEYTDRLLDHSCIRHALRRLSSTDLANSSIPMARLAVGLAGWQPCKSTVARNGHAQSSLFDATLQPRSPRSEHRQPIWQFVAIKRPLNWCRANRLR